MLISIVIPTYNGSASIGNLVHRLVEVLGETGLEIIIVNDYSPDNTDAVIVGLIAEFPKVITYVKLACNFGEHNAVMAGLHQAHGEYVVIMDDDFQNPPEEVPRFIEEARSRDLDVVYTTYVKKRHAWWRNLGSYFLNQVANFMIDKPRGLYLSSFKCLSRFAVRQIIEYTGPYPYLDGLLLRSTRRIGVILVQHQEREVGRSGYTFRKLVRLWLNMFFNFSIMPLRLSFLGGIVFSGVGFLVMFWVIVEKIVNPAVTMGYASLMTGIVFFAGVQLMVLGMLGEYLGRLFLSINKTPQFIIRECYRGGESELLEGMPQSLSASQVADKVAVMGVKKCSSGTG
ncbi:Undecaprenyl-phosphate 4-deoxy-4-formamido-L-arabinose transferase [Desulfovibrionales bacterium]